MHSLVRHSRNHQWSALILSMMITLIIMIIAIYLLDKIVPFSHDIKGVENGNIAYYRANTAVNEALFGMSRNTPEAEPAWGSTASGMMYRVSATGATLPKAGQWNSEYNNDWSIIGPGRPIQVAMPIGATVSWSTSPFKFRIPDLDRDGSYINQFLVGTGPIINWILSSSDGETLVSNGSQITPTDINTVAPVKFTDPSKQNGLTLSGIVVPFSSFYNDHCDSTRCTLKLSLVSPLILNDGNTAPYVEYQASVNPSVPLQTATVETSGYAGWFRQNITKYVQQTTINEALDFTVFQ